MAVEREGGKVDKIPRQPRRPDQGASTNSPNHWGSFAEAAHAYQAYDLNGVGYVLSKCGAEPELPVFAVDLDHCVDSVTGEVKPYAQAIIDTLKSYTETSPSGTGIRIFCRGQLPGPDVINHAEHVEIYDGTSPRYVTVTGQGGGSIRAIPADVLQALYTRYATKDRAAPASTATSPQPELPDEATCLALEQRARDVLSLATVSFWEAGELGDRYPSRSELIHASITDLLAQGWLRVDVFAAAWTNPHVSARYLEARQGNERRALAAIWADVGRAADYVAAHVQVYENTFADETVNLAPGDKPARKSNIISATDARVPRQVEWVIKHQVERGYIGELFGPANVGKSAIALDIASRIATGLHYAGHKVTAGDVLYVAGEGYAGLGRRLSGWALHHNLDPARVFLTRSAVPLSEKRAVSLLLEDVHANLIEPVLIVVDTLNRNYGPGSENDDETMRAFVQGLERLRDATGAAIMVVHHSGHGSAERSRGHSSFYGALDFSLRVEADKKEPGLIRMSCAKMKDHAYPRDMGFSLQAVALGLTDEDGEVITGVVAVERELAPPAQPGAVKAAVREVKDLAGMACLALAVLADTADTAPPPDAADAGALTVAKVTAWRDAFAAQHRADDRETVGKAFRRARADLVASGAVELTEDETYAWVSAIGLSELPSAKDHVAKILRRR